MSKKFRVVKIIDDTSLVINAGRNYDVKEGDKFQIYTEGSKIIDPVTNEDLGTLDYIKETLVVSVVYDKMCICETPVTYSSPITAPFSAILGTREQKNLNIDPLEISGTLSVEEQHIKVGDSARHLSKENN